MKYWEPLWQSRRVDFIIMKISINRRFARNGGRPPCSPLWGSYQSTPEESASHHFPDDPAAIHGCRLIISRAKQDASPNDCRNPEILKRNHHRYIHSFLGSWPAIFPDTDISSCVCIVLLIETSSSSHVQFIIARQRGPLGPETAMSNCI